MIGPLITGALARLTGFGLPSMDSVLKFFSSPIGILTIVVTAYLSGIVTEKFDSRRARSDMVAQSKREAAAMDARVETRAEARAAALTKARDAQIAVLQQRLEKYAAFPDSCIADARDIDHFGGLRGPRLLPGGKPSPPAR